MKIITYQLATEINRGTPEEPDIEVSIAAVSMPYTEANYQTALSEAYHGEITIEDDGQPEPERTEADQLWADVAELKEALNLILTGVTE